MAATLPIMSVKKGVTIEMSLPLAKELTNLRGRAGGGNLGKHSNCPETQLLKEDNGARGDEADIPSRPRRHADSGHDFGDFVLLYGPAESALQGELGRIVVDDAAEVF